MARETLKTFGMVMDNTADIKNIVINNFLKSLDLGNNDLLNEFVLEKLSDFNFCIVQDKFISKIQETINQEFKKIENSNGTIDYDNFKNSLINNLQQIKLDDIRLEDDIRNLSLQISDKFPMISRDAIYEKLSSKQESLKEVILATNKNVIDTLVNITPQLVQDLKQLEVNNQNKSQIQQQSQNTDNVDNNVQQQNLSSKNKNPHEIIQQIRKNIISKSKSIISTIQSPNPFNEFNSITIDQFQDEINKYGIDVDISYVEGVVYQIKLELYRDLVNKAKENIINDVFKSTNYKIDLLKIEDIIQNYKFKLNDEDMVEIIQYVNNRIIVENRKRPEINLNENQQVNVEQEKKVDIESQQQEIKSNNVSKQEEIVDLFKEYPGYKKLYECFLELANTETQKDAIEQIMKTGEYNGFKLNSMLSNKKDYTQVERNRRIKFAEMVLLDENLFLNLANNGLNCFHGSKINAIDSILRNGLVSSRELYQRGIELNSGEEKQYSSVLDELYGPVDPEAKRNFISLTDDFNVSVGYAGFHSNEEIEVFKRKYGKELKNDAIIICFNGNDVARKYGNSLAYVESMYPEIGIINSIDPTDIKCIITSPDLLKEVQLFASKYGVEVLAYDYEKFKNGLSANENGKFYSVRREIEIKDNEFEIVKEKRRKELEDSKEDYLGEKTIESFSEYTEMLEQLNDNKKTSSSNLNSTLDETSMKYYEDIKWKLIFDLTAQYNTTRPFISITANDLITRYNMNEKIAQNLALEINTLVENYIREKEMQNYTPYFLDGFEEEQEVSHKHR